MNCVEEVMLKNYNKCVIFCICGLDDDKELYMVEDILMMCMLIVLIIILVLVMVLGIFGLMLFNISKCIK